MIECDIKKLKEMIIANNDEDGKCFVYFIGNDEHGVKTVFAIVVSNKETRQVMFR